MRWLALWAPFLLGACLEGPTTLEHDAPVPMDDAPERACEVASVERLSDLEQAPEGYAFSPAELLDGATGEFFGAVVLGEMAVEGALLLDERVGEVRLVTARWSDNKAVCDTWYEMELAATLQAEDGLLDEVFSAVVETGPEGDLRFAMDIPQDQIRGALQGDPRVEAPVWLTVDAAFQEGWQGELIWWMEEPDAPVEVLRGSFSFGE